MSRAHATYLTVYGAALGFVAGFFLPAVLPIPVPWYYPLAHRWELTLRPNGLAMDWYGRDLFALAVGTLGGLALYGFSRLLRPKDPTRLFHALAAWTVSLFIFAAALYVYQLAPRHAYPAPFPAGYVPR